MTLNTITDFPQPDSPTTPKVSPGSRWKDTPSTALTSPSSVGNTVRNCLTSSRCAVPVGPVPTELDGLLPRATPAPGLTEVTLRREPHRAATSAVSSHVERFVWRQRWIGASLQLS